MEPDGSGEKLNKGRPTVKSPTMTLQKAVDMGEYDPEYLSTFAEWHSLSKHVQFQFIKTGLENRRGQLLQQWAHIVNVLDFRLKPELQEALDSIQKQLKVLDKDFETLSLEYFK